MHCFATNRKDAPCHVSVVPSSAPIRCATPFDPDPAAAGTLEDRRLLATFTPLPSAADGGPNSLRAAIIAANANRQDNTIILQAGTYQLTIPTPPVRRMARRRATST